MSTNTVLASAPLTTTGFHIKATGTTLGNSLIWDNGTNVGIGNTNTSYTLDVSGTGRFTTSLLVNDISISSSTMQASGNYYIGCNNANFIQFYTSNTDRMAITAAGNVGIGTTSPDSLLTVNGTSGTKSFALVNSGGGTRADFTITENDGLYINSNEGATARNIILQTGGTERMRITSGGNVGIATSSPLGRFDVYRAAGQSGTAAIVISNGEGGNGRNWSINTEVATEGDFAICVSTTNGGTPAPTGANSKFAISRTGVVTINALGTGTVTATSGVLSATSDMNLKIEDGFIDNALEKVMNLKPRYFLWKEETGLPTNLRQLGFYAQEVNEAIGEEGANTPKGENDRWGIYDRAIIAMLTKAIQEQNQTIQNLQEQINILAK